MRPLADIFREAMPAVARRFPRIAYVYLGGGAATGELRPWERIAVAYELRGDGGPPAFDEDELFADLAARFDTNDIDLFRLGTLSEADLAKFLRDAIAILVADPAAHRRLLDRRRRDPSPGQDPS